MPSSENDFTLQEELEFRARSSASWRLPPLQLVPEVGPLDEMGEDEVVPFSALAHFRPTD